MEKNSIGWGHKKEKLELRREKKKKIFQLTGIEGPRKGRKRGKNQRKKKREGASEKKST